MAKSLRLEDYQISATHGFLPFEPPLERLPAYYNPWEAICHSLARLRVEGQLSQIVAELPLLSSEHLDTEPAWRRAYVLLGFIASAYVWGPTKPMEILPASIAVPFVQVSEHLDMPPVATYAAGNLWNFRPLDPNQSIANPDNFCALTTFTDSDDESWFYALPSAIEARGAPIIPLILETFHAVSSDDLKSVMGCLQQIDGHIQALTALLPRMYEKCRPKTFYSEIRPFLGGTTGADLPNGVYYEDGRGSGVFRTNYGPTAVQSSLFQLLDIALGVSHRPTGTSHGATGNADGVAEKKNPLLEKWGQYLPPDHRRFLGDVSKITNIRHYVTSHPERTTLQEAYDVCLDALIAFRNKHVQMVSRYIVVPSRATHSSPMPQTEPGTAGRVPVVASVAPKKMALGTGGTAPVEFLKQVRDETKESRLRE